MRSLAVIAAVGLVLSPAAARVVWAQAPSAPMGSNAITQAGSLPQATATGMARQPRLPSPTPGGSASPTGDDLFRNIPAAPPPSEQYAANLGIYYRPMFYSNGEFGARLTRPPVDGSPAAQLRLEPGDTIFALDGIRFRTPADVLNHRAPTSVDLVNVRTNASQSFIVNRLKPDEARYHDNLGVALENKAQAGKGEYDTAIAEYREAIRLKPDEADYHDDLGDALAAKGERDAAIAEYREAIRLKPDEADYHDNLGIALGRKGEHDAAIAEYREAIRLKPDKADYHNELGNADAEISRWDEATAEYAKAIGLRPADYWSRYYYTRVRLAVGDSKGYRKACEDLLERFGQTDDPDTANSVAWTLTVVPNATTDFDRPLRLAEKAVAGAPKNFANLGTLGAALYRAGQFDVAVERLNKATEDQSQEGTIYNAYNWLFLAMAHHRLGHADEARTWLDKAVGRIDQLTKEDLGKADVGIPLTWDMRLELRLLRREAEVLVQAESR